MRKRVMKIKSLYLYRIYNYLLWNNEQSVNIERFAIIKETLKGYWLDVYTAKKFCLKTGKKRYAYPTINEAIVSFKSRKRRQIRILESQLNGAKQALGISVYDYTKQYDE